MNKVKLLTAGALLLSLIVIIACRSGMPMSEAKMSVDATISEAATASNRTNKAPIQAGQLTAGSFDDSREPKYFKEFMNEILQTDKDGHWPALKFDQLIRITVKNSSGKPLSNISLKVQPEQGGKTVTLKTHSNGEAFFFNNIDGSSSSGSFTLIAVPEGQQTFKAFSQSFNISKPTWEIILPDVQYQKADKLDLCFVIDATGSMGDELEYLKVETDSVINRVAESFPGVDIRLSLVVYRDQGDQYVSRSFDFSSLDNFCAKLKAQSASGGGDYPEAMHVALDDASKLNWRSGNTVRMTFLLADAPSHDDKARAVLKAVSKMRDNGIAIYPIAASGVAEKCEYLMRASALLTQGKYSFLTDDSGIGNKHEEPHIPYYSVQRLDHLMLHLIKSELSGRELPADPGKVIRKVGQKHEQN